MIIRNEIKKKQLGREKINIHNAVVRGRAFKRLPMRCRHRDEIVPYSAMACLCTINLLTIWTLFSRVRQQKK